MNEKGRKTNRRSNNNSRSKGANSRRQDTTKNARAYCSTKFEAGKPAERMEDIHSNDIAWWNRSVIYSDAVKVAHNRLPGYLYDEQKNFQALGLGFPGNVTGELSAAPSVMRFMYTPTLGVSNDANSPLNRSFTSLYAQLIAHTNSGNVGFTQASLALFTLAAVSIATNIGHCKRILGLRRVWHNSNANLPYTILHSLVQDVNMSETEWEHYRVVLNTLIDSFNSMMIPKYFSVFDRAFQLSYNVYADEDDIMAQFYTFMPSGYYVYDDVHNKVVWNQLGDNNLEADGIERNSLGKYLSVLNEQINALRSSSDTGLLMGTFRRAFPESAAMKFEYVQPDDVVTPWHDRNMLWQINNLINFDEDCQNMDVTENVIGDYIISRPCIKYGGQADLYTEVPIALYHANGRYLNAYDGNLSDEFIMEATRLSPILAQDALSIEGVGRMLHFLETGTEIVNRVHVFRMYKTDDGNIAFNSTRIPGIMVLNYAPTGDSSAVRGTAFTVANNFGLYDDFTQILRCITKFRNHPLIPIYGDTTDSLSSEVTNEEIRFVSTLGDLFKYLYLEPAQLVQLHTAAMQSAYIVNVPTNW